MGNENILEMEKLLSRVPNRFVLAVAAARRARQLQEGARKLVPYGDVRQQVLTGLQEIQAGKIAIEMTSELEIEKTDTSPAAGMTE